MNFLRLNPTKSELVSPSSGPKAVQGLLVSGLAVLLLMTLATSGEPARFDRAPEFPSQDPQQWIGPPQSLKALEGKVVLLDVWTFG